jgi:hypothetical protein
MAYYRQKYDQPAGSSAEPAPRTADGGGERNADMRGGSEGNADMRDGRRRRSHRGGRRNRPEGRQTVDGGVSEGKRGGADTSSTTSGNTGGRNKKPAAASPASKGEPRKAGRDSAVKAAEQGGQKKGILSKLLGVFKKK